MRVLMAAEENAWGGMIQQFRQRLPDVEFVASSGVGRREGLPAAAAAGS
ncbi:Uncharacterised protein [Klebsiella pneumoniae]|nr:Uncharacterised protein [Klebsiella pneumoniae]